MGRWKRKQRNYRPQGRHTSAARALSFDETDKNQEYAEITNERVTTTTTTVTTTTATPPFPYKTSGDHNRDNSEVKPQLEPPLPSSSIDSPNDATPRASNGTSTNKSFLNSTHSTLDNDDEDGDDDDDYNDDDDDDDDDDDEEEYNASESATENLSSSTSQHQDTPMDEVDLIMSSSSSSTHRHVYSYSSNHNDNTKKKSSTFSFIDRERIRDYFIQYRDGAERVFESHEEEEEEEEDVVSHDDETVVTGQDRRRCKKEGKRRVSFNIHTGNDKDDEDVNDDSETDDDDDDDDDMDEQEEEQNNSVIWISGHGFRELTDDVLSRPYLALPNSLSSKQRRCIHELCVDVGLYHSGAGDRTKKHNRRIVISIHSDGLDHVPDLSTPISIPIRRCTPWFYRNDHNTQTTTRWNWMDQVEKKLDADYDGTSLGGIDNDNDVPTTTTATSDGSSHGTNTPAVQPSYQSSRDYVKKMTKRGRELIDRMIDQPGRCLRDDLDIIDFEEIESEDLSSVAPPGKGDEDVIEGSSGGGDVCNDSDCSPWVLVDKAEKMIDCVKELEALHPSEIGFDLEMHNQSKYTQVTCLVQLSTNYGKDYIIDVLAPGVWDAMPLLAPIFAAPSIVKIGHCIGGMDVPSLHRDFGIFVVNAFDTYEAAKALRIKSAGLASVCEHYGLQSSEEYSKLKTEYQRTDWRRRPMTEPMIRYGRYDVHFLVKLRKLMIRDLTRGQLWDNAGLDELEEARIVAKALAATLRACQKYEDDEYGTDEDGVSLGDLCSPNSTISGEEGYFTPADGSLSIDSSFMDDDEEGSRGTPKRSRRKSVFGAKELRMHAGLMKVITLSQQRCACLWSDKSENAMKSHALVAAMRKASAGVGEWTGSHSLLYQKLIAWREEVARKEGTMPGNVCSLDLLVAVASKRPTCQQSLRRLSYFLPDLFEKGSDYTEQMLSLVRSSLGEDGVVKTSVIRKYERISPRHISIIKRKHVVVETRSSRSTRDMSVARGNGDKNDADDDTNKSEDAKCVQRSFSKQWAPLFGIKAMVIVAVGVVVAVHLLRRKRR